MSSRFDRWGLIGDDRLLTSAGSPDRRQKSGVKIRETTDHKKYILITLKKDQKYL
jgi:hypothetical protein